MTPGPGALRLPTRILPAVEARAADAPAAIDLALLERVHRDLSRL